MPSFLFLSLLFVLLPAALRAQAPVLATYAEARYQLQYPRSWQRRPAADGTGAAFYADSLRPNAAQLRLTVQPGLPNSPDSLAHQLRALPQLRLRLLTQRDSGAFTELRYDYSYRARPDDSAHTQVLGRRLWRGGTAFRVEYRTDGRAGRCLPAGRQALESFAFVAAAWPRQQYLALPCDNKMYGIAALRYRNEQWEEDCRTIHEFSSNNLALRPVLHRQALPFQSYALAKGFDNCLYSVTKAPTDAPERIYRYNPATRQGDYTAWQLPAQGPDAIWISAATDEDGNFFFLTSDANKLVKVNPYNGRVTVVWTSDPTRQAAYYPAIGFAGAGTHANFCLDDAGTLYLVYSTDGALIRIDLKTRRAAPDLLPIDGLPLRGGYSDVLMQNDAAGRRCVYLAAPKGLYAVDMARQQARLVRKGAYTDLAGCNIFRPGPRPLPLPAPPATARWQGRVLDAHTLQPLPQAALQLGPANAERVLPLGADGGFSHEALPGRAYVAHAYLAGYLATDTAWTATPGFLGRDLLLRPLTVGATLPLANVQFEQSKAVLLSTSAPALDKLLGLLRDNPGLTIELRGHTDNVGPGEKNIALSEQRVNTVKAYLVTRGIAAGRVRGVGLGGTQPVASNAQEATRRLNRRVEFRVTGVQ